MSCDNDATRGFGPLLPGNLKVDFGDADSLEKVFKGNEKCFSVFKFFLSERERERVSFPRLRFFSCLMLLVNCRKRR